VDVDVNDWYAVARTAEAATFFHTPLWSEIGGDVFGATSQRTRGFVTDAGVRVIVPAVGVGRPGPMQHLMSTVEGCYGGLIADGPITAQEATEVYGRIVGPAVLSFQFLESPMVQYELGDTFTARARSSSETAWLIDLDDGFETAYAGLPKRIREYHRSGVRRGVTIRESDSLADYRSAFEAYRDAVDRWGEESGYGYDWAVFERIHEAAMRFPDQIKLWVMCVDGQTVGGRLVFYWNRHAVLWHGTARREYLNHRVIPIADIAVMRDAAERGYLHYDLNTTGDHAQVIEYKRRMGASAVPLRIWRSESPSIRAGRWIKRLGRSD
jgi:hypothetical protein